MCGDITIAILDTDPVRRDAIVRLARSLGVGSVSVWERWPVELGEEYRSPTVVLMDPSLAGRGGLDLVNEIRRGRFLVALGRGEGGATPEILASGFGALLYEPVTAVDLERVLALARSVLARERDRERRQLVKLHALREVESELILLVEYSPDWVNRSLGLLAQILDVPALALWRVEWEENALVNEGAFGLPTPFIEEVERKARGRATALVHKVLESILRPVDMRPDSSDERVVTAAHFRQQLGLEAGVVVPIRRAGQIMALLSIYLRRLEDFDRDDVPLYDAAAEALAAAWAVAEARRDLVVNQQLYRTLVEEQPIGVVLCASDGTVRLANEAAARFLGYDAPQRLIGSRFPELIRALAPVPWDEWTQRSPAAPSVEMIIPVLGLDKRLRMLEFHVRVIELPGRAGRWEPAVQLVLEDVTLARRRLMELELLHDLTRMVSEERDLDAAFAMVADRLQREFGYGLVGLAVLSADGMRFLGRAVRVEGGLAYNEWRADRGVTGRAVRENRAQLVVDVRADPDYFDPQPDLPMESEVVAVLRRNGRPIGVLNIESRKGHRLDQEDLRLALNVAVHLELLMQQVELTEQLERQALSDPLTGLPNRRALLDHLRRLLADRQAEPVALILIDFDGFKVLNDERGHLFGDAVLQAVAQRLVQSVRPSDLIARYAGDEFAVVLAGVEPRIAREVAERLRVAVGSSPVMVGEEPVRLTISLGIAWAPQCGETPDALIRAADETLYLAKRRGGNAAMVYGEGEIAPTL